MNDTKTTAKVNCKLMFSPKSGRYFVAIKETNGNTVECYLKLDEAGAKKYFNDIGDTFTYEKGDRIGESDNRFFGRLPMKEVSAKEVKLKSVSSDELRLFD